MPELCVEGCDHCDAVEAVGEAEAAAMELPVGPNHVEEPND